MSCFFLILFNGMTINEIYEITSISRIKKSILARAFRGELGANAPCCGAFRLNRQRKKAAIIYGCLEKFSYKP